MGVTYSGSTRDYLPSGYLIFASTFKSFLCYLSLPGGCVRVCSWYVQGTNACLVLSQPQSRRGTLYVLLYIWCTRTWHRVSVLCFGHFRVICLGLAVFHFSYVLSRCFSLRFYFVFLSRSRYFLFSPMNSAFVRTYLVHSSEYTGSTESIYHKIPGYYVPGTSSRASNPEYSRNRIRRELTTKTLAVLAVWQSALATASAGSTQQQYPQYRTTQSTWKYRQYPQAVEIAKTRKYPRREYSQYLQEEPYQYWTPDMLPVLAVPPLILPGK